MEILLGASITIIAITILLVLFIGIGISFIIGCFFLIISFKELFSNNIDPLINFIRGLILSLISFLIFKLFLYITIEYIKFIGIS